MAGLTGQLGHGVVKVSGDLGIELVPLCRQHAGRPPRRRMERAFSDWPELAEATVAGSVTEPLWDLSPAAVEELAERIDGVLNIAGETDWAAPASAHLRVNCAGAVHGLELAKELGRVARRQPLYVYASSIHAAGAMQGLVPEARLGPLGSRTVYEHSKWLAEEQLCDPLRCAGAVVGVARVGGLIGDSQTGATVRRSSLYMLADLWERLPGRILPISGQGRVDMAPRDVIARSLLAFVRALDRARPEAPSIAHVCAGEDAPTIRALIECVRSLDGAGRLAEPRTVPVPARVLLGLSDSLDRVHEVPRKWRNAMIGLRYLTHDRTFDRTRLRSLVGDDVPQVTVEDVARLAFELPRPSSRLSAAQAVEGSFASFTPA